MHLFNMQQRHCTSFLHVHCLPIQTIHVQLLSKPCLCTIQCDFTTRSAIRFEATLLDIGRTLNQERLRSVQSGTPRTTATCRQQHTNMTFTYVCVTYGQAKIVCNTSPKVKIQLAELPQKLLIKARTAIPQPHIPNRFQHIPHVTFPTRAYLSQT